nr:retrovirus-related Pol polyprotein from transposon TNT 1-94 [Tanacetum cinerariifolium]
MLLMQAKENGVVLDEEQSLFIAGGQDNVVDEDVDELPVQDLALNVDNVFQADECDAFDSDVDEAPIAQTMFMANLLSADPVYDEVGPSYDLDILSEVQNHDNYQDAICEHHEVHEMHVNVQPNCVVDSNAEYTGDSNMILYDQFSEMHDAHTVAQACCLELEAELSKLKDKIQKDDHNEMVKHFSNLKLKETRSEADRTLDFRTLDIQIT